VLEAQLFSSTLRKVRRVGGFGQEFGKVRPGYYVMNFYNCSIED
jgi:hypothetical protein